MNLEILEDEILLSLIEEEDVWPLCILCGYPTEEADEVCIECTEMERANWD